MEHARETLENRLKWLQETKSQATTEISRLTFLLETEQQTFNNCCQGIADIEKALKKLK